MYSVRRDVPSVGQPTDLSKGVGMIHQSVKGMNGTHSLPFGSVTTSRKCSKLELGRLRGMIGQPKGVSLSAVLVASAIRRVRWREAFSRQSLRTR